MNNKKKKIPALLSFISQLSRILDSDWSILKLQRLFIQDNTQLLSENNDRC